MIKDCNAGLVFQLLFWYSPQQMSHHLDFSLQMKIVMQKLKFPLIVNHIAIIISVKITAK